MKKLGIREGKELVWGQPASQWIQIWTQIWLEQMLLRPAHIPTALIVLIIPLHESVTLHLRAFSCPVGQVRGCRSTYRAISSPGSSSYVMTLGVGGYIPQVPHLLVGILEASSFPAPAPLSCLTFSLLYLCFLGSTPASPRKLALRVLPQGLLPGT